MDKLKKAVLIVPFLLVFIISMVGCTNPEDKTAEIKFADEYQKYVPEVEKYCTNKNLRIKNYLGRTIVRFRDFKPNAGQKEPVVYEWGVENIASGEKLVLQYGPVIPSFEGKLIRNISSPILLSKERYQIKTKKF